MKPIEVDDILPYLQGSSYDNLQKIHQFVRDLPKGEIDLVCIEYFRLIKDNPNALRIQSHGSGFRQLSPPNWPRRVTNIHYEFFTTGSFVGVGIHFEPIAEQWPRSILEKAGSFVDLLKGKFLEANVSWLEQEGKKSRLAV